jgi:hypothetical protein
MKHFRLIFLITTLSSCLLYAQPYESIFGKDSTRWSYYTDYGGADFLATIFFFISSDTIIETKNYKILNYKYEMFLDSARFGYLREDTVVGKVWFLPINTGKEILYMDMALNVGDTFVFKIPSGNCKLDIVQTVSVVNEMKIIEFLHCSFIEGTGSTNGFFNFTEEGCGYSELLCAHKDGNQIYGTLGECYRERLDAIESYKLNYMKVFPNPTQSNLTIEFGSNERENTISLIDICGKILFTNHTNLSKLEIDLSEYHNGIYFLKLNNITIQKLIINGY